MPIDYEDPILVGHALENGPNAEGFIRVLIEPRFLRIALQLRQFLPSEVDLSKWL